jgi:hypothetical protein
MIDVGDIISARGGRHMKVVSVHTGPWTLRRYFKCRAEFESKTHTLYDDDEVKLVRKAAEKRSAE